MEKKRKKKGGSNWEKIGWNEDKKICPVDAKKVCPVTVIYPSTTPFILISLKKGKTFYPETMRK